MVEYVLRALDGTGFRGRIRDSDTSATFEEELGRQPTRRAAREPRPHQRVALEQLAEALREHDEVLLSLPTGAGKTYVAVRHAAQHVLSRGGRVLWIAHNQELIQQAADTFQRDAPGTRVTLWTGRRKDGSGNVVIASTSVQSPPPGRFDLLVVDEAHHASAPTYRTFRTYVQRQGGKEIGLTATPERLDRRSLGYQALVSPVSFMELVNRGELAKPEGLDFETGESFSLELDSIGGDFAPRSLRAMDTPRRNQLIVEYYRKHASTLGRTLMFALNTDHCYNLQDAFRRHAPHVRTAVVTGETHVDERNATVEAFGRGDLDVLINCKIFIEGYDCPGIRSVFLTRPTMSASYYLQMIGRGSRREPGKTRSTSSTPMTGTSSTTTSCRACGT
jgi:superfamily II DNA or RNA helicase